MHTSAWGWIDAPVDAVAVIAADAGRIGEWLDLVTESFGDGPLASGASVDVELDIAGREWGTLTVARVVRDVRHLTVAAAGGVGSICISLSAWDGGTAVELDAEVDAWAVRRPTVRRRLRRSIAQLSALARDAAARGVTAASPTTVADVSSPRWSGGFVPRPDAGPASRS